MAPSTSSKASAVSRSPYRQQSQLFHNEGDGRFRDVSREAGPFFDRLLVGRGVAFGDIDNDGDVDMVVTTNNGPAVVLLNQTCAPGRQSGADRHWIELDLRSPDGKRPMTGARVGVDARRPADAVAARADRRQLSVGERRPRPCRAWRAIPRIDRIVVQWPDGATESFTGVDVRPHRDAPRGRG